MASHGDLLAHYATLTDQLVKAANRLDDQDNPIMVERLDRDGNAIMKDGNVVYVPLKDKLDKDRLFWLADLSHMVDVSIPISDTESVPAAVVQRVQEVVSLLSQVYRDLVAIGFIGNTEYLGNVAVFCHTQAMTCLADIMVDTAIASGALDLEEAESVE